MTDEFQVKDSGARQEFASGMVRDTTDGKTDFLRVLEGPMLERWAEHLTKGAVKYPDLPDGRANWTLADGPEELRRFRASALRHLLQWLRGDRDEDHAAAVLFNINGAEYVLAGRTPKMLTEDRNRRQVAERTTPITYAEKQRREDEARARRLDELLRAGPPPLPPEMLDDLPPLSAFVEAAKYAHDITEDGRVIRDDEGSESPRDGRNCSPLVPGAAYTGHAYDEFCEQGQRPSDDDAIPPGHPDHIPRRYR